MYLNNLLKGMGQTDAYVKAGYSNNPRTVKTNASRLLANANFAKYYNKAKQRAANKAEATQARILREECRLAYSDLRQIFDGDTTIPPDKLPEDVARAIGGVEITERVIMGNDGEELMERKYKYKFWDKGRALERISKHLGMYKEHNDQKAAKVESLTVTLVAPDGSTKEVAIER